MQNCLFTEPQRSESHGTFPGSVPPQNWIIRHIIDPLRSSYFSNRTFGLSEVTRTGNSVKLETWSSVKLPELEILKLKNQKLRLCWSTGISTLQSITFCSRKAQLRCIFLLFVIPVQITLQSWNSRLLIVIATVKLTFWTVFIDRFATTHDESGKAQTNLTRKRSSLKVGKNVSGRSVPRRERGRLPLG